ncbi:MAG: phage shock protein PspA [Spirochaetales bacterium]|nr:phage shock protein PspA [Spirochaetales bacterium]
MSIFSRFRDIVNSNINDILDKVEDPEKMIRLMIQEMEDTLVELKSSCAGKMASRAEVNREKEYLEKTLERWEGRARLALEKDREDLAREALLEKKNCINQIELMDKDLEHFSKLIDECKSNILQLEQKLEEVRQKHKLLIQRGRHAAETKQARSAMRQADGTAAFQRFNELERTVEKMEAEAELSGIGMKTDSSIEHEFDKLESESEIDEELEALKKSMKGKEKS